MKPERHPEDNGPEDHVAGDFDKVTGTAMFIATIFGLTVWTGPLWMPVVRNIEAAFSHNEAAVTTPKLLAPQKPLAVARPAAGKTNPRP